MNDLNNVTSFVLLDNGVEPSSSQAYYDYYDVVSRQDVTNSKLDNQFKLLSDGFTYLNFIVTMFLLYFFIRKMMGRS